MIVENDRLTALENNLIDYPAILTPDHVADILGVSRRTVDDYIKAGIINAFTLDPTKERKLYRVTKDSLLAYISNNNNNLGGQDK